MKKLIVGVILSLSSFILVACSGDDNSLESEKSNDSSSVKPSAILEEDITFTGGVDKTGVTYADEDNYANIKGETSDSGPIYIIYDGTVLDEITIENDGTFFYNTKTNETNTMITFSTDDNLEFGQKNISIKDLSVAEVVNIIPNPDFLAKQNSGVISVSNPKQEASNIKANYFPSSEISLVQEEYADGLQDVYNVGEDVSILLTNKETIQQIVFNNLKKDEVINILKDYEYPDTPSVNNFLDENEHYFDPGYNNVSSFTYYENLGVNLSAKSEGTKKLKGDNPFTMILIPDKERLDWFKENK